MSVMGFHKKFERTLMELCESWNRSISDYSPQSGALKTTFIILHLLSLNIQFIQCQAFNWSALLIPNSGSILGNIILASPVITFNKKYLNHFFSENVVQHVREIIYQLIHYASDVTTCTIQLVLEYLEWNTYFLKLCSHLRYLCQSSTVRKYRERNFHGFF